MTNDLCDSPQPLSTIPVLYRMLLGQYLLNRKEVEVKKEKEARQFFKNRLKGLKEVSEPIPPGKKVGFKAAMLDRFGNEVFYTGGFKVLESLTALDVGTLAALVEINRINLLRIEKELFARRFVSFLIAGFGVVVSLYKMPVFNNPIVIYSLKLLGQVLFQYWWPWILLPCIDLVWEFVLWRPGKLRVEEFGQMLVVVFAYVSKLPSSENNKGKEIKKDGEGGQGGS